MLDRFFCPKFSRECKSLMKNIHARIEILKKKNAAMIKYHKRDIADLLSRGRDGEAYKRAEELLKELDLDDCYDEIKEFSNCVLNHLGIMQKQRYYPEECTVAVSTLIFSAARFAELPELRHLRHLFTERYGDSFESAVDKKFERKATANHHTKEQKLVLMEDISREHSVKWDSRSFDLSLSTPSNSSHVIRRETFDDLALSNQINSSQKYQSNPINPIRNRDFHGVSNCTEHRRTKSAPFISKFEAAENLETLNTYINPCPGREDDENDTMSQSPRHFNERDTSHHQPKPKWVRTTQVKPPILDDKQSKETLNQDHLHDQNVNDKKDLILDQQAQLKQNKIAVKDLKVSKVMDSTGFFRVQNEEETRLLTGKDHFHGENISPSVYTHPKLPDYNDLAARFAALKTKESMKHSAELFHLHTDL